MTKTRTSMSLSESAINSLANEDNKSLIVNQILEELYSQKNSLEIIQNEMSVISYKKIVELGVEALKETAIRYKNLRAFADLQKQAAPAPVKLTRGTAIKNNIDKVNTWEELVNLLDSYDFTDLTNNNFTSYANHQYYYPSCLVERATSGAYYVDKVGGIVEA